MMSFVFRRSVLIPLVAAMTGLSAGAVTVFSTSCGTVAAPLACSITVNGDTTFTATDFTFVSGFGSGGGHAYEGGDIDINISSGGGRTALLEFSKHPSSPTPGIVFLANPGETAAFTFSYVMTVSPFASGTVAFDDDVISSFDETHTNNALATYQTVLVGSPSCLAFTGSTTANCALPAGTTTVLNVGDILSLTGNTGNTGITVFRSLFQAGFTASEVPEPSTLMMWGLGIGLVSVRRFRR